nr:MAG TPA: nucleic-acid-binding protein [Caudoviricetes sp.]
MDWGFVTVDTDNGKSYKIACFAMICHHCGQRYIEFFKNKPLKEVLNYRGMRNSGKRIS